MWERKVGKTPIARLGWLLRFAQSEVPSSEKQLAKIDEQIEAFVLLGASGLGHLARSAEAITNIRDDLLKNLRLIANWNPKNLGNTGWWVPLDGLGFYVRKGWRSGYSAGRDTRHNVFMAIAGGLVGSEEGKRIQSCARQGCDHLFIRRKRGLYCTPACSQREQTRKYRERQRKLRLRWNRESDRKKGEARKAGRESANAQG
jgi:hypothetical protein